jgi:bacterioferritin
MAKGSFVLDVQEIRRRAREHMSQGAVTSKYGADREAVLKLLNEALATEIVCTLRYKRHYFMAQGLSSKSVAAEFAEHASEEQEHADRIAERITQLDGKPDFNPAGLLARSHSEYVEGENLVDMIKENLVAERIAIDTYGEIIRYLGNDDPTTRAMFESILASEEEHAEDMQNLLGSVGESQKRADAAQPRPNGGPKHPAPH